MSPGRSSATGAWVSRDTRTPTLARATTIPSMASFLGLDRAAPESSSPPARAATRVLRLPAATAPRRARSSVERRLVPRPILAQLLRLANGEQLGSVLEHPGQDQLVEAVA